MARQPLHLEHAKNRISATWFAFFVTILTIFFWQNHIIDKYGPDHAAAWTWFLGVFGPALGPTTAFVIGVIFFVTPAAEELTVSRMAYRIAIWAVSLYLIGIIALLCCEPIFNRGPAEKWLDRMSALVLVVQTFVQGAVDVCLASFLVRTQPR